MPRRRSLRVNLKEVFVKNLDSSVDVNTLKNIFAEFGRVLSCRGFGEDGKVAYDYAFIEFDSKESAQRAVRECNGRPLFGRTLSVELCGVKNPNKVLLNCHNGKSKVCSLRKWRRVLSQKS